MLNCVKCGKALTFPQFECSKCKGDFCRDCANEMQKCKACATILSRFRMPETGATRDFVPGSGS